VKWDEGNRKTKIGSLEYKLEILNGIVALGSSMR
jgi:hypothetical protein